MILHVQFFLFSMNERQTKYLKRFINLADQRSFKLLFPRVFFPRHRVEFGESGCPFALVSQGLNIPYFRPIQFVQFLLFYKFNIVLHFWWRNDNQNNWKELSICLINMASKCVLLEFSFLIIGLDFGCKGYPSLTGFKHSPIQTCKISKKNTFLNVKRLFKFNERTTTKIFEKCCQSGCLVGLQNAFSTSVFPHNMG